MKKDQFILSVDKLLNSGRKDPVSGISQPPFATKKRQGVEKLYESVASRGGDRESGRKHPYPLRGPFRFCS